MIWIPTDHFKHDFFLIKIASKILCKGLNLLSLISQFRRFRIFEIFHFLDTKNFNREISILLEFVWERWIWTRFRIFTFGNPVLTPNDIRICLLFFINVRPLHQPSLYFLNKKWFSSSKLVDLKIDRILEISEKIQKSIWKDFHRIFFFRFL